MSKTAQVSVHTVLGSFKELKELLDNNLLLTPEDLWKIYTSLPTDLSFKDSSEISVLDVVYAICDHPNLAPEQILFFLEHPKALMRFKAIMHRNIPHSVLIKLVEKAINKKKYKELNRIISHFLLDGRFVDQLIAGDFLGTLDHMETEGEEPFELMIKAEPFLPGVCKYLLRHAYKLEHFTYLKNPQLTIPLDCWSHLLLNPKACRSLLFYGRYHLFKNKEFYSHPNVSSEMKNEGLKFTKKHLPYLYYFYLELAQQCEDFELEEKTNAGD